MSLTRDLAYFLPQLGPRRAASLLCRKVSKALARRSLAGDLNQPEADAALWRRLLLADDPTRRTEQLGRLWQGVAGAVSDGVPEDNGARARAVLGGTQNLFGRDIEVGWLPRWDWRWNGTDAEMDFREDIRSTWEIQRLQGLLPLARAAGAGDGAPASDEPTADPGGPTPDQAATAYLDALADFHLRHPGPHGPAWSSALEVGLRLVALVQTLPLLADRPAFRERGALPFRILDRHARWLRVDLSTDKVVRGNHLLGELSGLVAAGHLLPAAGGVWWDGLDVQSLLEQEILRQFHPDGVSVEQSLTYEKFVLEFLIVAGAMARLRGRPFPANVVERITRALSHLEAVTAPDGSLPRVGDCDSGRGADWGDPDPHRLDGLPDRVRRVFGEGTAGGASSGRAGESGLRVRHFAEGGHLVVDAARGMGPYLFLRGGPFGWGDRGPASHSHADWLSPVLFLGPDPVLVDPGVYGYRTASRDEDRSWSGHSAVTFETPADPRPGGTFRWESIPRPARLTWETGDQGLEIRGEVVWDRPRGPLLWQRILRYNELESIWLIQDRITGDIEGPVTWAFHFAPGCRVEPESGGARVELASGRRLVLDVEPAGEIRVEKGWVASGYGSREPAPVLRRRLDSMPETTRVRITPAD